MNLFLYRLISAFFSTESKSFVKKRFRMGRENTASVKQRLGFAITRRPHGALLWVNANGMDAAITTQNLIDKLLTKHPDWHILFTTGTLMSVRAIKDELPANVILQYGFIDLEECIDRFLSYWKPDMAIMIEQKMRPLTFMGIHKRKIPAIMINGQLNEKQFRRWKMWGKSLTRKMLSPFRHIHAQSHYEAEKIEILGGCKARFAGNFKYTAKPLNSDESELKILDEDLDGRPLWLASNIHIKEEVMLAEAHKIILEEYPDSLLIIVPRNADHSDLIRKKLIKLDLDVSMRTEVARVSKNTQVYIGDIHEELGLFYRATNIAFIGGSLVPVGGHNLVQAAQLNCAILHGPHMHDVEVIKEAFEANHASMMVNGVKDLAAAVKMLFKNKQKAAGLANRAYHLVDEESFVLHDIIRDVEKIMEESGY